jgi:site-specific DNA-methyltransferase (cytosine-N4-specific)
MSGDLVLSWHNYRYFPYERRLARREVESLFGTPPRLNRKGMIVPGNGQRAQIATRLTYTRAVLNGNGVLAEPTQARLERSLAEREKRAGAQVGQRRQQTRYSAHGLHEYRGKYNPQIVRALGNIFSLGPGARVLDPFCGSGTTLLECLHNGWSGVGIDANPLAVLIANAKIASVREIDSGLLETADRVCARIADRTTGICHERSVSGVVLRRVAGAGWLASLPNSEYVARWFPGPVLAQLAVALQEIQRLTRPTHRAVLLTLLSDELRGASLQDPADLRIRRRQSPSPNYPLVDRFVAATREKLQRVARARRELDLTDTAQVAYDGDSRRLLQKHGSDFDAVITSPPYATALPYIDTQRLSLCALGLVDASHLRAAEASLIGNREIDRRARETAISEIRDNAGELPSSIARLCEQMLTASQRPNNGFRRQNTPALVYKYFRDMSDVFEGLATRVKMGAPIALVVGRNRAKLGDTEFEIDTPALLRDVACDRGLRFVELAELDAYFRFGMHQRNSIRGEALLVLKR